MATDLLLLAAHAPEFAGLQARLGEALQGRVGAHEVACRMVGVGLSAAGAGCARALCELRPRAALLLGSVGAYPGRKAVAAPLTLGVVERALLVDAATALGKAALPPPMQSPVDADPALCAGLRAVTGAAGMHVATTLGITTDDGLAAAIARLHPCDAENLEAHAVFAACHAAGVRCAALLVTTNAVGAAGRAQWQRHQADAARRGTAGALAWLDAGAPGLDAC